MAVVLGVVQGNTMRTHGSFKKTFLFSIPYAVRLCERPLLRRVLFLVLLLNGAVFSARALDSANGNGIHNLDDLNGKRIGALAGSSMDISVGNRLDYTQIIYFDDYAGMIDALAKGKIDAVVHDEPVARTLAAGNPSLRMLPDLFERVGYAFAVNYGDPNLYEAVNGVIDENLKNGGMERLVAKWVDGPESGKILPEVKDAAPPPLRLGTYPDLPPFTYVDSQNRTIGLDIELARQIAARLGRRLEIVPMEFSELIPSLNRGDVDVIGSCIIVTEERARLVRFTDAYYQGGVAALVLETSPSGETGK